MTPKQTHQGRQDETADQTGHWTGHDVAHNVILLGDPAVRPVAEKHRIDGV